MTGRAGNFQGGVTDVLYSSPRRTGRAGSLMRFVGGGVTASLTYKNEGWYAAGSVWETWITADDPATTPPSGHGLTFLQHMVVQ